MYRKIDFHSHLLPASYVAALKRHIPGDPDGWPTPVWTPELTLGFMAENGIDYSVLSLSSPHVNFGDKNETLRLVQDVNDLGAQLHADHPDKLGFFASLPLPYVAESIAAVRTSLKQPGCHGFTVPTNTAGLYLGSPVLDPVYEALNAAHAVVALHPNQPSALPVGVDRGLPTPLLGFFIDTTMTVMNLLKYHWFERFPDIRLIIPHAGAFMGILADRVAGFVRKAYGTDIYEVLRNCYFDTAGHVLPRQLPALLSLADPHHIIYGSDIPYTPLAGSAALREALESTEQLGEEQKLAIFHENGARLLR